MSERMAIGSMNDQTSQANLQARKQVVIMLFTVVVCFFICLLPMQTIRLYFVWATKERIKKLGLEGYLGILYFARVMLYVNSAINPICYNLVSTKFRDAFRRVFGCGSPRHSLRRRNTFTTSVETDHDRVRRTRSNCSSSRVPLTRLSSNPTTEVTHNDQEESMEMNHCGPTHGLINTSLVDRRYHNDQAQSV